MSGSRESRFENKDGALKKSSAPSWNNFSYAFQIMSATVLPAGMNGMTCVL